ncbi:GNAT family N-acetyltransferase [Bremerella sp. JC817]|uniref:GNAT family N-acetyltransferase n=1 Tax=Bremerella sp. JC817 TaxID=3231756 RepID=UPI00345A8A30
MISLRTAGLVDLPRIEELRALAFESNRSIYRPIASATQALPVARGTRVEVIATLVGVDVGVVGLYCDPSEPEVLCITGLGVVPSMRKRGVARKLIAFALQMARENCHTAVSLFTIRETGNVGLFEKMGFAVVTESEANWCRSETFDRLHEVTMRRSV